MGLLDGIFDRDKDKKDDRPAPAAPRADFSDVRGASETTAPSAAPRTYTVQSGDSLSKIAQRELGAADRWPAIYEANRDKITNPDLIHPGQVLTMPAR